MVENFILFIPLGMLLCGLDLITKPVRPWKNRKAYRIVRFITSMIFALFFTCIIEGLQLYLKVGVFTLDDILCNETGALAGYIFILVVVLLVKKFGKGNKEVKAEQANEQQ